MSEDRPAGRVVALALRFEGLQLEGQGARDALSIVAHFRPVEVFGEGFAVYDTPILFRGQLREEELSEILLLDYLAEAIAAGRLTALLEVADQEDALPLDATTILRAEGFDDEDGRGLRLALQLR